MNPETKPEIGDIVFFLTELSIKTGVIVGIITESNKTDLKLICPATAERKKYLVSEINSNKQVLEYTKTTILESEIMTLDNAITELKDRVEEYLLN